MLLPHGTVIAVIDGQNLELWRNAGDEADPRLDQLPAPRLDAHNHSGASHRSSPGNHADSQVAEDAHAIASAEWLNAQVLGHKLDKLVVFAPPRTLGELRKHWHKQTGQAILKEVSKDMAGKAAGEILLALREKG